MIFRLILCALLFSACNTKETQRNPHQEKQESLPISENSRTSCAETYTDSLARLCNVESMTASEAATLIFSPALIQNPALFYNDLLDPILWQIGYMVLEKNDSSLIENYINRIINGCVLTDAESCKVFHRFSRINNTHDLFLKYLQYKKTNIKNIESFIILTDATLVNRSPLPLLHEIAINANHLKKDSRLISIINNYLAIYTDRIQSEDKKNLLKYTDSRDGSFLNLLSKSELASQINEMHKEIPLNIFQKSDELLSKRKRLVEALSLKRLPKTTLIQLLDLIDSQLLDLGDSKEILTKLSLEKDLLPTLLEFMRWTTAYQISQTDLQAQLILQRMNVGSRDLFDRFQYDADEIRKSWSFYKYQQQKLINNLLKASLSTITKQKIRASTSALNQTIKMYSEYPHMFYLATYLAQQDFSRTMKIGTASVDMSSNAIFNEITNPLRTKLSWFKYTEDYFPLNDFLIRSSLSYMIRSDFFTTMNVDVELFLGYFLKNLNSHYSERHHRRILTMNSFIATDNTYKRLNELCTTKNPEVKIEFEELKNGFILPTFSEKTFIDPITVMTDSFNIKVILDPVTGKEGYTGSSTGYMPFDWEYIPDFYEYARTDLNYLQRLLELLQKNLRVVGHESQLVKKSLEKVEKNRSYAKSSFKQWNQIGACRMKIIKEERKVLEHVYEQEKKYLSKLHVDLKTLRNTNSQEEAQLIIERYKGIASYLWDELTPLGVKGLDVISKEGYLATQFNFYSRVAQYLKSYTGAIHLKVVPPPEIKKSLYYSYRDLGGNQHTVQPRFILYQDDFNSFLKSFNQIYFSSALSFTRWLGLDSLALALHPYLKGLAANLSMGYISSSEYISNFKNITSYFKISPTEEEILRSLDDRALFGIHIFSEFFIEYSNKLAVYVRKYGFFDITLSILLEDILGYDYQGNLLLSRQDTVIDPATEKSVKSRLRMRHGLRAEAQIMYDTLRDPALNYMFFPLDASIVKNEYSILKQKIAAQNQLVDSFIKEVQSEDFSQIRIDLYLDDSITGPVFSPFILDRHRTQTFEFQQKTSHCFNPDSNCF